MGSLTDTIMKRLTRERDEARAALVAAEAQTKQVRSLVEEYEYHGCLTGDCPHTKQSDCYAEIWQQHQSLVNDLRATLLGAGAAPRKKG